MADMRRFGFADFLMLVLVLAVAAGTRAGYVYYCADKGQNEGPLRVEDPVQLLPGQSAPDTEALIANVKNKVWFRSEAPFSTGEEATAHVAPGYPYLIGLLAQYLPEEKKIEEPKFNELNPGEAKPDEEKKKEDAPKPAVKPAGSQLYMYVRWIQVGLGTLTAGFYYLFARRAFRSLMVGTLAGLFAAAHPFWVVDVATIADGTLAGTALALCLLLASQAGEKGGPLKSLLLGGSLAGLALVKAAFLPFSFVLLIWFLLRSRSLKLGWLYAVCAFLGFGAALAPWTIRNYQVFEGPVPVVSSTYLHLWIGNNPKATGGPATDDMWTDEIKAELTAVPRQPDRYQVLANKVVDEVKQQPLKTMHRRLTAIQVFLFGDSYLKDRTLAVQTEDGKRDTPPWLLQSDEYVFQGVLLGMVVLTFLGWRWSYGWKDECVPAALAMMWVPLPYILGHAGALSSARLPLDGVFLCFSAFALCCFVPGLGGYLLAGAKAAKSKVGSQR